MPQDRIERLHRHVKRQLRRLQRAPQHPPETAAVLVQHPRLLRQVAQRDTPGQLQRARHDHLHRDAAQPLPLEARGRLVVARQVDQRGVDAVGIQVGQQFRRPAAGNAHAQRREGLAQRAQRLLQRDLGKERRDAEAELAAHLLAARHARAQIVQRNQHAPAQLVGVAARRGGPQRLRLAIQQRHAQRVLQALDAPRDPGLGQVQLGGRGQDRAVLDHRHEGFEIPRVHADSA